MTNEHSTSEERLIAYLTACDPDRVRLDRFAHASPIEVRMLGRVRR